MVKYLDFYLLPFRSMKFLNQFSTPVTNHRFVYNSETPSADPNAELLAAQAEFARERGELSEEVLAEAMGLARAVNGLNVNTDIPDFRLEGPYNINFNVPLASITSAEQAADVLNTYRQLINEGHLEFDDDTIYYLEDLDGEEATLTPEGLQALLGLEPSLPEPVIEMAPPLVSVAAPDPVGLEMTEGDPLEIPENPNDLLPPEAPGMDTGEPLNVDAADLLPPAPEPVARSEAEILQAMQDPSLPLGPEELTFLEDFEIVERLVAYPEENAAIQTQLLERLTTLSGGPISRSDCADLAERSHYFIATRSPNLTLSEEAIATALLGLSRQAQGIEAVEGGRLNEAQQAQVQALLGEADTTTFLENRPTHETAAETIAVARSLSILSGRALELQPEIDAIPARITAIQNGEVRPDELLTPMGPGYHTSSEIQAVRRLGNRLQEQQTDYANAYNQVLNGEISVSDESIRALIDSAQAAISGDLLAAQAEDDGLEAAEVSPEVQARLDRGRTFVDAFAQFRTNSDLPDQAYQLLNNNDVEGVEAIIEEMLDASVRH
jgi:hypothetical protein